MTYLPRAQKSCVVTHCFRDRELEQYRPYQNVTDLRRAATHLLISMLPLALHYATLEVEVCIKLFQPLRSCCANDILTQRIVFFSRLFFFLHLFSSNAPHLFLLDRWFLTWDVRPTKGNF